MSDKKHKIKTLKKSAQQLERETSSQERPKILSPNERNYSDLENLINSYLNALEDPNKYIDDDIKEQFFEEVIDTFLSPKAWDWINERFFEQ